MPCAERREPRVPHRVIVIVWVDVRGTLSNVCSINFWSRRCGSNEGVTVADERVQDYPVGKRAPRGLPLHDYVNLYFDARNPMMYTLKKNSVVPYSRRAVVSTRSSSRASDAAEDFLLCDRWWIVNWT